MIAHESCSWDFLFLTFFGLGELLHYVWSIISSENPISFRMKKFLFSLSMVITVLEVYSSFFLQTLFISLYFISIPYLVYLFYHICNLLSAYALCPNPLCDLVKPKAEENVVSPMYSLGPTTLCDLDQS